MGGASCSEDKQGAVCQLWVYLSWQMVLPSVKGSFLVASLTAATWRSRACADSFD